MQKMVKQTPGSEWIEGRQATQTPEDVQVAGVNYLDRPATTILAGWKRGMISM